MIIIRERAEIICPCDTCPNNQQSPNMGCACNKLWTARFQMILNEEPWETAAEEGA